MATAEHGVSMNLLHDNWVPVNRWIQRCIQRHMVRCGRVCGIQEVTDCKQIDNPCSQWRENEHCVLKNRILVIGYLPWWRCWWQTMWSMSEIQSGRLKCHSSNVDYAREHISVTYLNTQAAIFHNASTCILVSHMWMKEYPRYGSLCCIRRSVAGYLLRKKIGYPIDIRDTLKYPILTPFSYHDHHWTGTHTHAHTIGDPGANSS